MVNTLVVILLYISTPYISTNAQWIVTHSKLPAYNKQHPKDFLFNIAWSTEEEKTTNITLNLRKSDAVGRYIPLFSTGEDGKPVQTDLISMKHTTFYNDIHTQASLSLTSFDGEPFSLKGSLVAGTEKYDIQPYHSSIHKRSLGAVKGDHIVSLRPDKSTAEVVDFKMPDEDSEDYARLQRSWARYKKLEQMQSEGKKERKRRQNLPATTYVVQLYIIVDVYAYNALIDLSTNLSWPGGADDFIAFYIGHQASEIDTRYRNVDSSISPVGASWTIGTKFSYLQVAKTNGDSSWTYPPTDASNLQMDADTGLEDLNNWVNSHGSLPSGADHVMLITSLDLASGGQLSTAGLAYVGGTCGTFKTSINELTSTTVYAHELGHNMGASHDGSSNSCSGDDQYVMAPSSGTTDSVTKGNPWYFSSCSTEYFHTYIEELNSGTNCLTNEGSYVDTWADDYQGYIGQEIPVDEQCAQSYGDGYIYYTGEFAEVCQKLWCWTGSGSYFSGGAALTYTSCGNKKWCIEESCVYDANAPELNEDCPFGDSPGRIFSNDDEECSTVEQRTCGSSSYAREFCCATCPTLATPWLGPDCPYGDTLTGCEGLNDASCAANAASCCDSCCLQNGPADGYSCVQPITTSSSVTAPTVTATDSSATSLNTESTLSTATTKLTTAVPTTTRTYRKGYRKLSFKLVVRINSFVNANYQCDDSQLQDTTSSTSAAFVLAVCESFKRHVRKVQGCQITGVSCGSILVNSTIAVEQNDSDSTAEAAPSNQVQFLQQISGILSDSELVVTEAPIVEDVNECEDPSLNDCSSNANCTNTDGHYSCECNLDYDDLSLYEDELGRICIEKCDKHCGSIRFRLSQYLLFFALMLLLMQLA